MGSRSTTAFCVYASIVMMRGQVPTNVTVTASGSAQAVNNITTSGNFTVTGNPTTTYTAGNQITLLPGFHAIAQSGATPAFIAGIAQPATVFPSGGIGASQTFTITATDPGGYQNISNVQILYNWQPSGIDGCALNYDAVNDALHVGDLTGSMSTFGSMSLRSPSGTLGDITGSNPGNSNCLIVGAGSGIATYGNNLVLSLNVQFRSGFVGAQNIYMVTSTAYGSTGSYQLIGTWTGFGASSTPPTATPVTSINSDGTVTLQVSDVNGFGYVPYVELVIGASQTDAGACRVRYDRGTGAGNHVLSLYAGDFMQVSLIGIAPVGTPGAVVQNASTCRLDIGNSYVVSEAGAGDVLNLALTFKSTGTINTYAQAFDRQGGAGSAQSAINLPSSGFSLSAISGISVQQSGTPAAFILNAPLSGNFAGPVNLTYTAPAGVAVTLESGTLNAAGSPASTAVQVTASPNASVGNGNIAITGTSGSQHSVVSVPVAVVAATDTPAQNGFYLLPVSFVALVPGEFRPIQLNVPVTGSFSGPVAFTYTAPPRSVSHLRVEPPYCSRRDLHDCDRGRLIRQPWGVRDHNNHR